MRTTASIAWIALTLTGLLVAGCATKTQAPVADRETPQRRSPSQGLGQSEAGRASTYVVKRGDTLYSIAALNGVDHRELAEINNIKDPSELHVGQVLTLTRPGTAGDTGATGAVAVNPIATTGPVEARPLGAAGTAPAGTVPPVVATSPSVAAPGAPGVKTSPKAPKLPYSEQNLALLRRGEDVRPAQPAQAAPEPEKPAATATPPQSVSTQGGLSWAWPAAGKIIDTFKQSGGKGVAIGGKLGDPVYASAAGTVVYSGEGLPGYGKLIIVKHNDEYLSVYGHNSAILVKEKQTVARGQKIAEMGTSGTGAPTPRLHFEIRRQGKTVDPEQFLPQRP
jgi:lipoprotein NlpD